MTSAINWWYSTPLMVWQGIGPCSYKKKKIGRNFLVLFLSTFWCNVGLWGSEIRTAVPRNHSGRGECSILMGVDKTAWPECNKSLFYKSESKQWGYSSDNLKHYLFAVYCHELYQHFPKKTHVTLVWTLWMESAGWCVLGWVGFHVSLGVWVSPSSHPEKKPRVQSYSNTEEQD